LARTTDAAIELDAIDTFYGDSHIIQGLSLSVGRGEAVSILGRNAVGKTTTLRSIVGLTPPRDGQVRIDGDNVTDWPPHRIVRKGIAYVPAERHIFPGLTVEENLRLAARPAAGDGWTMERVYRLFPVLAARRAQDGATLSGGEQQMLALGRALMGNPRIMLLDEPSQGLAPVFVHAFTEIVRELCGRYGLTLLLVEQNFRIALKLASRHYLMESKGQIRRVVTTQELHDDREILRRHLAV